MNNKIEPRILPGFMELLPNEQIVFDSIINKIKNCYEKFGFLPLDTPIIELSEVLLAKAGDETEKQIYRFNKGENDLSLRFDLTVPLARYISEHYANLAFPFKRYQIGKVYRGERPQKGRYREFYQCDIDIIGDGELDIANDAEMPVVIYNIFKELDFGDFTININNRKILSGFFESLGLANLSIDIMRIIDKIDKIGLENVRLCLIDLGIEETKIKEIEKFILVSGTNNEIINKLESMNISNDLFNEGVKQIKEVTKYMRLFEIPEECFSINLKISRGLDYYTGTVYETFLNEYKNIGSVCSGGRYDNLAKYYTDKKLPGVGISIGLTRLFYILNELNIIKQSNNAISKAIVFSMDDNLDECIKIANEIRKNNINTQVYMEDKKIKNKIKYADKLNVKYIIIIGEEEIATKRYTLKNIQTGQQDKFLLQDIIEKLKNEG